MNNLTVELKSQVQTVDGKTALFSQNSLLCKLSLQGKNQFQNNCFSKYVENFRKIFSLLIILS